MPAAYVSRDAIHACCDRHRDADGFLAGERPRRPCSLANQGSNHRWEQRPAFGQGPGGDWPTTSKITFGDLHRTLTVNARVELPWNATGDGHLDRARQDRAGSWSAPAKRSPGQEFAPCGEHGVGVDPTRPLIGKPFQVEMALAERLTEQQTEPRPKKA